MEIRVGMHDDATAGTISDWISGSSTFPARLHYKIDITNLGLITLFAKSAAAAATRHWSTRRHARKWFCLNKNSHSLICAIGSTYIHKRWSTFDLPLHKSHRREQEINLWYNPNVKSHEMQLHSIFQFFKLIQFDYTLFREFSSSLCRSLCSGSWLSQGDGERSKKPLVTWMTTRVPRKTSHVIGIFSRTTVDSICRHWRRQTEEIIYISNSNKSLTPSSNGFSNTNRVNISYI